LHGDEGPLILFVTEPHRMHDSWRMLLEPGKIALAVVIFVQFVVAFFIDN
jgi:hypothetical protein